MRIAILSLIIIVNTLVILFINEIELHCVNNHFSWLFSKMVPYLLLVIGGILLAIVLSGFVPFFNLLKKVIQITVFPLPFLIGFAIHPIYQADFNQGRQKNAQTYIENETKDELMVITIPNCPYCYNSIQTLKTLANKNPKLNINFIVCSTDPNKLETYKNEVAGAFPIKLSKDMKKLAKTADFSFPAFVLVRDGKPTRKWSNNEFGARAFDQISE